METSLLTAIENIQSQAPAKAPSDYPTVGFEHLRHIDADQVANAIQQAFEEGYSRAMWEVDQQLKPIAHEVEILQNEADRMRTFLEGGSFQPSWENPDGPQAA